jgi:alkanesulfonate monooxygenase
MQFFWFLPTHGDGEYLGRTDDARHGFQYYLQIVKCLDKLGYDGILIPIGPMFEEPWVYSAALASHTVNLKYLVAIHPSSFSPAYVARQVASFDRMSKGRVMLNIVVGGNQVDLNNDGVFLSPEQRYQQADEFLQIYKALMTDGRADFNGKYYRLGEAELNFEPYQKPFPALYSAGTSEAGLELAARHVDWYIMWADPVDVVARRVKDLRKRAMQFGRSIRFGIRVHFVVRETGDLAWEAAKRLMSRLSEQEVQRAICRFKAEEGSAQKISFALHRGDASRLEIAPNLWGGVSLARGGALTALVGDPETIRTRVREYEAAGIDLVIGSGTPHLEEAEVVFKYIIQPT